MKQDGRARRGGVVALGLAVATLLAAPLFAAGHGEPGEVRAVRVELTDPARQLKLLEEMRADVDGVFDGWARVYLLPEELDKLQRQGFVTSVLPDEGRIGAARMELEGVASGAVGMRGSVPSAYHTYTTLTQDLQAIAAAHPSITRLASIGQSVQGRELWMMKITDNPDSHEDEPAVAYIAAMHGDEVVGKEMVYGLIDWLTSTYGSDARATALVDETEIWIMPSMNPDGTQLVQRYNANGFDLNRSFPDWYADPNNTPGGRQPEVAAVMGWTEDHAINLSANFHGGALLVNYPFDNNPAGASVFSPTPDPDQPAFVSISLTYASNNPPMFASSEFPNGVTNGADWYAISGGMQDWNYCWYGNFQVTLEIGTKWPSASTLPQYWNDNFEAMLSYFERVHEGVRGVVTDAATGAPVAATILIDSDPFPVYADPNVGDYHRIVLPGSHTLHVSAFGYAPLSVPITVAAGPAVRYDVQLAPLPAELQAVAIRVEDGGNGWLDPGEAVDLAVTLRNLGNSATNVEAHLVPTGWYATVERDDATFPGIPTGQSVESDAPHYAVEVAPDAPEGAQVGFAFAWTADQGSGTTEPFFLAVGAPSCSTDASSDVPKSVLDFQVATSTLLVAPGAEIADVQVTVDISHTYIGDLRVSLISPAGTEVVLHNRTGGGANDIVGTYGAGLTPFQSLSAFEGQSSAGTWTLRVHDQAGGDTGAVEAWSLEICGHPAALLPPEMRFRDLAVGPSGVELSWWPYPGLTSYRVYRGTSPVALGDVTAEDADPGDTEFLDASADPLVYYLVTGVGPAGEGP